MLLKSCLMSLSLVLLLSGCSILRPEKQVIVKTEYVERKIPLQNSPRPLSLNSIYWHVVTKENFEEFIKKYSDETGEMWVFYAISVRSYETMALNMADIRRYIEQQKAIIVYYETAITKRVDNETK
jgi:cytosine/uracil/thiamine/allantoin permease